MVIKVSDFNFYEIKVIPTYLCLHLLTTWWKQGSLKRVFETIIVKQNRNKKVGNRAWIRPYVHRNEKTELEVLP